MQKNSGIISSGLLILMIICVLPVSAQSAPPEPEITYGNKGTRELGLGGSIQFPMVIKNPRKTLPKRWGPPRLCCSPTLSSFLPMAFTST